MDYILVTGGLGFIGSHTVVELIQSHKNVIIIDNMSTSTYSAVEGITNIVKKVPFFYKSNYENTDVLEHIFNTYNISCVFHFAGSKAVAESVSYPLEYYQNNVVNTITLLNIMAKHGCKKIVFSSSATVYGNQPSPLTEDTPVGTGITNPYGRTKYVIELILRDLCVSDPKWSAAILRYFNPIGAHQSGLIGENTVGTPNNLFPYLLRVASGKYPELKVFGNDYGTPDGTCIRDYIHVTDLARAHVATITRLSIPGMHIYNVGTGKGTSVKELIETFEHVNHVTIPHRVVERRVGDVPIVYADSSKMKEEIGWEASCSVSDMCRDGYNYIIR